MEKNRIRLVGCLIKVACLIIVMKTGLFAGDENISSKDLVVITPVAIKIPLNRFLIVHRESNYCALKFTKFWKGKTEQDFFAECQSYYQADILRDFLEKTTITKLQELSFPKPRGIGRFAFSFGTMNIQCGPFNLYWFGEGWVKFYGKNQEEGDHGIEFAPTKWTDISQVKVLDKRLTWYRYDSKRNDMEIPIDELWDEDE